jgi:hypothetical protein
VREHPALAETPRGEARCGRANGLRQLRIRNHPAARRIDQSRLVAELASTTKDKISETHIRNLDVRERAADHHWKPS